VSSVERMTTVRGVELSVAVEGDGPTLVWGHGLTSCAAAEDASGLFAWLAPGALPGIRVIRYDARSHGRSAVGGTDVDHRWPELARDLLAVADAVDAPRFAAGGVSMGCATSLWAALSAPERVTALLLAAPPTAWATRAAQADLYRLGADLVEQHGVEAFVQASRLQPAPALLAGEPELREGQLAWLATMDPDGLTLALRGAAASDLPALDALRALEVPALILAWDGDPSHPVSTAEEIHGALAGSQLFVAESLDAVRQWPPYVRAFLDEVAPTRS